MLLAKLNELGLLCTHATPADRTEKFFISHILRTGKRVESHVNKTDCFALSFCHFIYERLPHVISVDICVDRMAFFSPSLSFHGGSALIFFLGTKKILVGNNFLLFRSFLA